MLYKLLRLFIRGISHLPFVLLYAFSFVGYIFLFYVIGYRRRVIEENLKRAFPEKSDEKRKHIVKNFYKNLAEFGVETLKLMTLNEKQLKKFFKLSTPSLQLSQKYYKEDRDLIVLASHVFNWEYFCLCPAIMDYTILIAYQVLENPFWEKEMKEVRGKFGGIMVDYRKIYSRMLSYKNQKKTTLTWVTLDQNPPKDSRLIKIDNFLKQPTYFNGGIDMLAKRTNSVVFFMGVRKPKKSQYEAYFELITDSPREMSQDYITRSYAKKLENLIVQNPSLWLWSHKRWKRQV